MPKFDLNQLIKKKIKIFRKKYFYIENCLYLCTDESQKSFFEILKTKKQVYLSYFIFTYFINTNNLNIAEINKRKNTKVTNF